MIISLIGDKGGPYQFKETREKQVLEEIYKAPK